MKEYDPEIVEIYSRYKRGEINKNEAKQLLRPYFGPHDGPVISALLSALTRHNVVDIKGSKKNN